MGDEAANVQRDVDLLRRVEQLERMVGGGLARAFADAPAPESTSTLCNGEGGRPVRCNHFPGQRECDWCRERPIAETIDSLESGGLRNIVGDHPAPANDFEAEVTAHAAVRDAADATWSAPKWPAGAAAGEPIPMPFIQSEREHYTPPDPEDRPMAETFDSLTAERGILRTVKETALSAGGELSEEQLFDAMQKVWDGRRPAEFIQSEREHYTPPSPAFDPRAATETCAHKGCRRKAFGSLSNIEGDSWLSCAEHYEQDLAAQARSDGHEPAWRVPIGPGVVLERWRGGPIGVKVDGELRCYVTAGELARIFEGPVA
jgi:hypothetical protein